MSACTVAPANVPGALTVSASDLSTKWGVTSATDKESVYQFANSGNCTDLFAPGAQPCACAGADRLCMVFLANVLQVCNRHLLSLALDFGQESIFMRHAAASTAAQSSTTQHTHLRLEHQWPSHMPLALLPSFSQVCSCCLKVCSSTRPVVQENSDTCLSPRQSRRHAAGSPCGDRRRRNAWSAGPQFFAPGHPQQDAVCGAAAATDLCCGGASGHRDRSARPA